MTSPIPLLAPVMTATFTSSSPISTPPSRPDSLRPVSLRPVLYGHSRYAAARRGGGAMMTDFEHVRYSVEDGIATLTLHRPERLNAVHGAMLREIVAALDAADGDDAVRAL